MDGRFQAYAYQAQFTKAQFQKQIAHAQWLWVCCNTQGKHGPTPQTSRGRTGPRPISGDLGAQQVVGKAKKSLLLAYPTTKFLIAPVNMTLRGIGISFRSTTHHFIVQKSQFISLGIPPNFG